MGGQCGCLVRDSSVEAEPKKPAPASTPVQAAEVPKSPKEETKPDPDMAEKVAEAPPDTGREDEAEVPEKPSTVEPLAVEAEQVAADQTPVPEKPSASVAEVAADQTPPRKASEPPAKEVVSYAVGDNVVVISSFTANSHHSHQLEPGMKGTVTEVDEEGDALLDFEDADELLWLYPDDLIHLEKADPDDDDDEDKEDM